METPAQHTTPQTPKSAILAILEDRPIAYHPILATQASPFVSASNIVEWSEELGYRTSGIYFLIDRGEIVYVGQSRHEILTRLAHHVAKKQFDSVTVLQYPADYALDTLEAEYIWRLQPKYNTTLPTNPYYMKKSLLKDRLHKGGRSLNRIIDQNKIKSRVGGYYDIRDFQEQEQ